jgi:hypothetical protein
LARTIKQDERGFYYSNADSPPARFYFRSWREAAADLAIEIGVTDDGHCFRNIEIETETGVEEACLLAMERAKEVDRVGDVCCWEAFESSGQAEYVDSISNEDSRLDVPVEYRCWTERNLLQQITELKAEIDRLRGWGPVVKKRTDRERQC